MRFSFLGGFIHFDHPVNEGHTLKELGMIEVREDGDGFDVQPTAKLRAMVESGIELETLYPLLVELVMCHCPMRLFVNQRHVEWRLLRAGMTRDGLEQLDDMLRSFARR